MYCLLLLLVLLLLGVLKVFIPPQVFEVEESWDAAQRSAGVEAGDLFRQEGQKLRRGMEVGEMQAVGRKGEVPDGKAQNSQ